MGSRSLLTVEMARHLFDLDVDTGVLRWKNPPGCKMKAGDVAGSFNNGYFRVRCFGRTYQVHRIVWLMVRGAWPEQQIDHIDRCRTNNAPSNLRDVDGRLNTFNRACSNRSGIRGVYPRNGRWMACCANRYLGIFDTTEEAAAAYRGEALAQYGEVA